MVSSTARNLSKPDLGGVIFGCTHDTMKECLNKQLFGLPGQHLCYVQNIEPGLPLFLFNYSDRKLYGIYEAECCGQLNLNPYGWSSNGSQKTKYPAQVRIRTRMQCEPLQEKQFKPIIVQNYYNPGHFRFELDHTQASALISLFGSSPVTGGSNKWVPKLALNTEPAPEVKELIPLLSKSDISCSDKSNIVGVPSDIPSICEQKQLLAHTHMNEEENEEQIVYLKLEKLAREHNYTNSSATDRVTDIVSPCDANTKQVDVGVTERLQGAASNDEETLTIDLQSVIHQLTQEMNELKFFSKEQLQKTSLMEKEMAESRSEVQRLRDRVQFLESQLDPSIARVAETMANAFNDLHLSGNELMFLLGGYDGCSLLSSLDCYSTCWDILKSLQPMSVPRSHAAAAALDGHIYVFGGGNGSMWYDTVEMYNLLSNEWTPCPSLSVEKGNLAGAALHGKLYAIGGGNKHHCLSDVEVFDPFLWQWVHTSSMKQKRFSPASAALNGALYVVGGYNGEEYMNSAERLDPRRATSWEYLPSMNIGRGCHSLIAFDEKLYAFGGNDGMRTVSSVEVLDPRFGSWTNGLSMNLPRGYAGAVVIGDSICVIGGVQNGPTGPIYVDSVERYNEGNGWTLTNSTAIGKRCFFSAIVL